ncbi:MAG: hypothetical protein H0V44_11750 [Planctomycetes bacterium]|nr:hypothetical protein [Planctomycetota bacterium]
MPLLIPFLFSLRLVAASATDEAHGKWSMHWRVFCDPQAGVSFRYPYDLFPRDQYAGDLTDRRKQLIIPSTATKEEVQELVKKARETASTGPDIHQFSFAASDLVGKSALPEVGDHAADEKLEWKTIDYYREPSERPFADPKWAPDGIEAMVGTAEKRCGIVVKHGDRFSGIILAGGLTEGDNQKVMDSFEVLSTGKKLKKDEKPDKSARAMTWREAQGRQGKVIDSTGKCVVPKKDKPIAWRDAWELETQHYHVTTDYSAMRLMQHGPYLEALFQAYSKLYEPAVMPPYKFEVHIFSTYREFGDCSNAWGCGFTMGGGGIVGGFFVPGLLSLWVYEESGKLGGDDFSIEHVTAHECSHQFLHVTCNGSNHVPTWINEGLAVYFESGIFKNGEFVIRSPTKRIDRLRAIYVSENATLIPLDQYLDHHGHISPDQYGEVFSMTSFWVFGTCAQDCKHKHKEGKPDCGLVRFREFFGDLKKGEDGNEAFERIFMADMVKAKGSREKAVEFWQKSLLEYVKSRLK